MGFFEKLKQGLSKTASSISSVFTASELDDEFYDDLEESLIVSDLGMDTTEAVMDRLRQTAKEQHIKTVDEAKLALRGILADMLNVGDPACGSTRSRRSSSSSASTASARPPPSASSPTSCTIRARRSCCARATRSAPRQPISLRSGRSVRTATSSASTRARTPPPSFLTPSRRQERAAATSSSATPQAACTTSRTS